MNTTHKLGPVESFVALFDILGFSEMVKNRELTRVTAIYRRMRKEFKSILTATGTVLSGRLPISFKSFSDTFVIYTFDTKTNTKDPFLLLMLGCASLFIAANRDNLRLRGAVTFGEIYTSKDVVIGKPIVEAFRLEKEQDWIGCCISEECCEKILPQIEKYSHDLNIIIEYEVPLKMGPVKKMYAFNWVKALCFYLSIVNRGADLNVGQVSGAITFLNEDCGEREDWKVRRKLNNTIKFRDDVLTPGFVEGHNKWVREHFPSKGVKTLES